MKSSSSLGLTFLLSVSLGALLALYSLHSGQVHSPVVLPGEKTLQVVTWAPQGWAFFTKDPKEKGVELYHRQGGEVVRLGPPRNADARHAFGLIKTGRAQMIEAAMLMETLTAAAWTRCEREPEPCLLASTARPRQVRNLHPMRSLCGEVGVVRQPPVPWAWAGSNTVMPSEVLWLEVEC